MLNRLLITVADSPREQALSLLELFFVDLAARKPFLEDGQRTVWRVARLGPTPRATYVSHGQHNGEYYRAPEQQHH
jgi:hypothetical protein